MRKKSVILCILLFFIVSMLLSKNVEAVSYDPELNWYVLESPNFSIYFHQKTNPDNQNNIHSTNIGHLAQEIANIAEGAMDKINTQLPSPKHHHLQKIAIIIEDFSDYALGFASSFPHRVIRISLTAPTAKSFDMKFKSWLEMVIVHEYTHIAQFEMTGGLTTTLRALFGQVLVPNALQPTWSTEGLAVYNETKFTDGGRSIDSRYDMYLRMAALEDQFNTLDQITGYYLTSWPGGIAPYIYGQSLIHFIAEKYGEDKITILNETFCRYPYFGMNYALKKAIGLNLSELFQAWKNSLTERYQSQKQSITLSKNLTISQQLTKYNYWADYPKWIPTPEGEKIAVRISTPHTYPFIQIIDPLKSKTFSASIANKSRQLIKRVFGRDSSFSVSIDGAKIIYSRLEDYERYYEFYNLYLFDLQTKKEFQLSKGLRVRDPNWSPNLDDPKIIAVINESGNNNLVLINLSHLHLDINQKNASEILLTKEDIIYLTDFHDGTQIYQPCWSPDGKMIAASIWCQGFQDIYISNFITILDAVNESSILLYPIFQDQFNDLSPCWSPDGQYLFFSSDRTGIYNIFAYSLINKKLYQVTNVIGGAFQPAVSSDGKSLAFINYHSTGYELHLMKLDAKQWTEIEYIKKSQVSERQQSNLLNITNQQFLNLNNSYQNNYPIHPYEPFTSLWPPTYWIPAIQITDNDLCIGFSTEMIDTLEFYSIPLTVTYGLINDSINYNLGYYNYRQSPIINFYLSGENALTSQNEMLDQNSSTLISNETSTTASLWKKGKIGLNLYFPSTGKTSSSKNSRSYRQTVSLGYQCEKLPPASNSLSTNIESEKITSLRLGYIYSDTEKYGFSISPEEGQSFSLTYEHADAVLGGDYTFDKLVFDGRKFIPLPFLNQVLAFRLAAGFSSPHLMDSDLDEEKYKLGGYVSANNLGNIDNNAFALRGYNSSFLVGNNFLLTSLEYRFPIANIEHSLKIGPLSFFLERFSGTFFIDIGNAWENPPLSIINNTNTEEEINASWKDFKVGVGGELKADFAQKYNSPFTLRLGVAKALSEPKGYSIYFTLGSSF